MEEQFIDPEAYGGKKNEATMKTIIISHISKISQITTSEFKEGYHVKKPVSTGGGIYMSETYVEDKRLAYINSVDFLEDVLLPDFDEEMEKFAKKIDKELDERLKKLKKEEGNPTDWIDEKLLFKRQMFREINKLFKRIKYFVSHEEHD